MRLNQVRDFLAVVDAGSISGAARALRVSQPGLTKSLAALEAELNAPLLQRGSRGVRLTTFGRAFHARARAAHSELEKARQELLQLSGGRLGRVAVGFGPFAAAFVVPQAVCRFRADYPQVEIRLIEGFAHALLPLVREQALDMALAARLPGAQAEPGLRFRPVFHNEQIVVCRHGHPLARARSLRDLRGAEWVSFEPRAIFTRMLASSGLQELGAVTQCESMNVMLQVLAGSDMLAVVSSRLLTLAAAAGLHHIRVAERLPSLTTGLYVPSGSQLTPAAAAMARLLVELGRKLPAVRQDTGQALRA